MAAVVIGGVILPHGLMLAPMAGVTDAAYRSIAFRYGAEYAVTEMVSAKALCYGDRKTEALLRRPAGEPPCGIQLFGSEPDVMAKAAALLCDRPDAPPILDINMGCPMKKITGNGEGSALMREPALAGAIVRAVVSASSVPVTVKLRAGWDDGHRNAVEIARICEENGAAALVVHGRTRAQLYADPVDLSVIAAVKQAVSIPVFGNGSLNTPLQVLTMLRDTGCDGAALARGTMGCPWLFRETAALLDGTAYTPPSPEEILSAALDQLRGMLADKPERIAIHEARRQMSYYIHDRRGSAAARAALMSAETKEEIEDTLRAVLTPVA